MPRGRDTAPNSMTQPEHAPPSRPASRGGPPPKPTIVNMPSAASYHNLAKVLAEKAKMDGPGLGRQNVLSTPESFNWNKRRSSVSGNTVRASTSNGIRATANAISVSTPGTRVSVRNSTVNRVSVNAVTPLHDDLSVLEEDPFFILVGDMLQEHVKQVAELRQENEEMKTKLGSVLQATWDMGNDGWHGHPHKPEHSTLCLMTEEKITSVETATRKSSFVVPLDFENPMKSIENGWCEAELDNFDVREDWLKDEEDKDNAVVGRKSIKGHVPDDFLIEETSEDESKETLTLATEHFCGRLVTHPGSTKRLIWDICGMVLLMYDVIMVPIGAFSPNDTVFTIVMDWCTLIFWTFDMAASCLTGYIHKGTTVMKPGKIFKHYLRTFFILDVVIVVPDWLFTVASLIGFTAEGEGTDATKLLRSLRSFRMVRALRLLRLAKLRRLLVLAKDHIQSELVFKAVNVVQILIMLIFANHFICSTWYALGGQSNDNWISKAGIENDPLADRYFSSMQWSLQHFTLGSANIYPQSSVEHLFAIVMMTMGMCFLCVFTAYITVALQQSQDSRMESSTQMWLLRRYLRQERVPLNLTYRILRYAEYALGNQKQTLGESKVAVLAYLSDGLRTELKYEASFSVVGCHHLFEYALSVSRKTIQNLANEVFSRTSLASKETLFKPRQLAGHMYIVASGELLYGRKAGHPHQMHAGEWLCESTLWVKWMTRGTARASRKECSVINIDEHAFCESIRLDDELWNIMSDYAMQFVEWLNDEDVEDLMDIINDDARALMQTWVGKKPSSPIHYSQGSR